MGFNVLATDVCLRRGRFRYLVLFTLVEVFLWLVLVGKGILIWILNTFIWIVTRWLCGLPYLRITLTDIGFLKAYSVIIEWKNNVILTAEELGIKIELVSWRNVSFKLLVKSLHKTTDSLDALFSFTLYWRILPLRTTSTGLERNKELQDNIKTKITRLQATDGRIILKPQRNGRIWKGSPKIVLKIKAAEAVFISAANIFIINGRANKVTCSLMGRRHKNNSKKRDHLTDMACLRLKLVFPKDSPEQISIRYYGTRVRITKSNLKDVLWTVNEYEKFMSEDEASISVDEERASTKSVASHSNAQLSKVKIFAEDMVLSIGTRRVPEIAAIKVSLDITADNWIGKSRCSGSIAIQGVSISDLNAIDPCIILGNDLITASWRCSFSCIHVYKRCLIFSAESNEILSVIMRPDCFEVFARLHQDYSFLYKDGGKATLSQLGETIKFTMEEYCPRTQISTTLEGINVCLEMDVFEKLAACTLEDIRLQCTRDAENLSCDFTVKDIEVEDRINNVLAVRMSTTDGIQKRSLHATVIQEATTEKRSVSFQQLYGELADFTISVEEDLLLKLLVFCGITTKKRLWGEETTNRQQSQTPNHGVHSSPVEEVSLFFDKLELSSFDVVCCLSPKQELPQDLLKLKEDLGIPNGLPPCVENARLDFERLLRTGIYYKSLDGLLRDIKRHYLKEVGRQSAKILGSLHLLGNVTGLKDNIAEGLAELRETGNLMGFAGHVRSGLTESYYKLADSWSAYVKTPTKVQQPSSTSSTPTAVEEPPVEETTNQDTVNAPPGLLSSLTTSLGGWVFNSQDEDLEVTDESELNASLLQPVTTEETPDCHTSQRDCHCHTPQRDCHTPQRDCHCHTPQRDRSWRDYNEEDRQSSFNMSTITTAAEWELVPPVNQKQLKGEQFVKRLKQSMNDTETEERFICCVKLRFNDPDNKLNALVTSRKVYFMSVGLPVRDHVVLDVSLEKLYKAQEKDDGDVKYLELIMRMDGMQRLSLPSPNPGDNPLVRCDSIHLATKAASRINNAKKIYHSSDYTCPCSVILNSVNYS